MKILLIKRLESSFYAFRLTVERFVNSYEHFLEELENGNVYVSKKHTNKIFEFLDNDDMEAIQRLIDEDKADVYPAKEFQPKFKKDLEADLSVLREIEKLWQGIKRDPKLISFEDKLTKNEILKKQKLIVFTESKETADYLAKNLEKLFPTDLLLYTGGSSAVIREKVIENFDARARYPKDMTRILITTKFILKASTFIAPMWLSTTISPGTPPALCSVSDVLTVSIPNSIRFTASPSSRPSSQTTR